MEENIDGKPCMFHDPLALQATEKSFYDLNDKKNPLSPSIDYPSHFDIYAEGQKSLFDRTCESVRLMVVLLLHHGVVILEIMNFQWGNIVLLMDLYSPHSLVHNRWFL
ncbi:hypothetical protein LIER_40184 [Lithospermum erythrorhizon]|uniref:Uncharacterized protein n=1 Tax=Lithospermum erythrorhizon TaxID=34254 RepID=A0AAV3QWE7_LITER